MIRPAHLSLPFERPQPPCPDAPGAEADPVFDLSFLDNARENYFLPGVDRLAATLAGTFEGPAKVRLEAEGQFLEYTLHSDRVEGSLNGNAFALAKEDAGAGAWRLEGDTPGGKVKVKVSDKPDGTRAIGLVNGMPFNQGIHRLEGSYELDGNFACARLAQSVDSEGRVSGTLGRHTLAYQVATEGDGYLIQGQFGDLSFRQTITPA